MISYTTSSHRLTSYLRLSNRRRRASFRRFNCRSGRTQNREQEAWRGGVARAKTYEREAGKEVLFERGDAQGERKVAERDGIHRESGLVARVCVRTRSQIGLLDERNAQGEVGNIRVRSRRQ